MKAVFKIRRYTEREVDSLISLMTANGYKVSFEKGDRAWETSDSEDFEKSVFIAIATAPTIEERKKGKWIYLTGLDAFECSV